jgi:hypothetical protein
VRLDIFRRLLEPMTPGRLVDIGAGHGAFAALADELGWKVTAVDARTDRFPDSSTIEWVNADLRGFDVQGYDAICLLGVLYHLELDAQLDLLRRCAGTVTILDTHVTDRVEVKMGAYEGWLFDERQEEATASWGNEQSFWPTQDSLDRMLRDCGYQSVFKLEPSYYPNRTFYLCL